MSRMINYIKLFWYFAVNWNLRLAGFMILHEIRGEKKYGLDTSRPQELKDLTITSGDIRQGSRYEAVNYFILESLLQKITELTANRSIVDLGCGKGRAMAVAAHYGFTQIKGIDFAEEVCQEAEKNMLNVTKTKQVSYEIICGDVLDYAIQKEDTIFFMFNPFDKQVLFHFLENLEISLEKHPRIIYFLYASPRHIELLFEYEYEPVFRKRKLKWLDGVILKKNPFYQENIEEA